MSALKKVAWQGGALTRLRDEHSWSKRKVELAIGAKSGQVFRWESNQHAPGAEFCMRLALLFKVPVSTFFGIKAKPGDMENQIAELVRAAMRPLICGQVRK